MKDFFVLFVIFIFPCIIAYYCFRFFGIQVSSESKPELLFFFSAAWFILSNIIGFILSKLLNT